MEEEGRKGPLETVRGAERREGTLVTPGPGAGFGDLRGAERRGAWPRVQTTWWRGGGVTGRDSCAARRAKPREGERSIGNQRSHSTSPA